MVGVGGLDNDNVDKGGPIARCIAAMMVASSMPGGMHGVSGLEGSKGQGEHGLVYWFLDLFLYRHRFKVYAGMELDLCIPLLAGVGGLG